MNSVPESAVIETSGAGRAGSSRRTAAPARVVVFLAAILCLTAQLSFAEDALVGKLADIDGASATVNIMRPGKTGLIRAGVGDPVFAGDTVRTPAGVRARIHLSDQSVINIGPDSTIRMKAFSISPREVHRNYVLKALKGTIRFIISKAFRNSAGTEAPWKNSTVNIETTTAVAGIRGTDLVVTTGLAGKTPTVDIAVLEGQVVVRSLSLSIRESVTLMANQVTTVQRNSRPGQPVALSDNQNTIFRNATTLSAEPAQGRKKPSKEARKKYTKKDAARELAAADRPVSDVLEEAAASGMSIEEVIAMALDAGVPADALVYTAIADGFAADAVVSAALAEGAALTDVVSAAFSGGAETNEIIDGGTEAGFSSTELADPISEQTLDSPVYGYDPLSETTEPESPLPGADTGINTPPGETPSTLPASPSQ